MPTQIKVEHKQKSPNIGSRKYDKPITAGATSVEEQSPAGSSIILISRATNTVFAIKVAKNVRVRSDTAEQQPLHGGVLYVQTVGTTEDGHKL